MSANGLPENVTRRNIPLMGDVVTVSNPQILRTLVDHPDIARPDQGTLPTPMAFLLHATQFYAHSAHGTDYPVAFTTTAQDDQAQRRARVVQNLSSGFTDEQVDKMRELVRSEKEQYDVAKEVVRLVGPGIIGLPEGEKIPEDILDAMQVMDLHHILNPISYFKARLARGKVQRWVAESFPEEEHIVDIAHDLVTLFHGFSTGLVGLRAMQGNDIAAHLGRNPILPASIRIPRITTTCGGLFPEDAPLEKDKTVIVMDNGSCAVETLDLDFVFGMGSKHRQCPFRHLFVSTGEKIMDPQDQEPPAGQENDPNASVTVETSS